MRTLQTVAGLLGPAVRRPNQTNPIPNPFQSQAPLISSGGLLQEVRGIGNGGCGCAMALPLPDFAVGRDQVRVQADVFTHGPAGGQLQKQAQEIIFTVPTGQDLKDPVQEG